MIKKPTPVVFQGLEAGMKMSRWILVVLVVLFFCSGISNVQSGYEGLQLRFGELYRIKSAGLLPALPYPIDEVIMVPVKQERLVEINEVWKEVTDTGAFDEIDPVTEGYCLTGDQNVVQTQVVAKYKISDPVQFRLWTAQPDDILRDTVLAALTQTIGATPIDEVLRAQGGALDSLAKTVQQRAQGRLDELQCGMTITAMDVKEIHPPRHVYDEFRAVRIEETAKKTAIEQARGQAERTIINAKAQANQLVAEASAYRDSLIAKANAEVSVFEKVYNDYQENPGMVWQRILLETLEEIYQNVGSLHYVAPGSKVIIGVEKQPSE